MARGRRSSLARLIEDLDGTIEAKQRLQLLLETLAGTRTLVEAGQQLGISDRHLRTLREDLLQQAVCWLQPRAPGRPGKTLPVDTTDPLQEEVQQLRIELKAAQIREEIALVFPHLLRRTRGTKKTKTRRKQR